MTEEFIRYVFSEKKSSFLEQYSPPTRVQERIFLILLTQFVYNYGGKREQNQLHSIQSREWAFVEWTPHQTEEEKTLINQCLDKHFYRPQPTRTEASLLYEMIYNPKNGEKPEEKRELVENRIFKNLLNDKKPNIERVTLMPSGKTVHYYKLKQHTLSGKDVPWESILCDCITTCWKLGFNILEYFYLTLKYSIPFYESQFHPSLLFDINDITNAIEKAEIKLNIKDSVIKKEWNYLAGLI